MFKWITDMFSSGPSAGGMNDMSKPAVNIDGTPMVGDVDTNGNSFGVTSDNSFGSDDSFSSSSGGFGNDF